MDPSDYPVRSPKRELQGPRPTPLKVRKDSHKIKKPPLAPSNQHHHHHQQQQQQPPPPPVIIYTVSPKVIHTNPSEFMTLVQRLTGAAGTASSASSSSNPFNFENSGAISPAARYATIEKTRTPAEGKKTVTAGELESFEGVERAGNFPAGILSPGPTTLPPISPNFFAPGFDANMLGNLLHDLSPMVNNNQGISNKINFLEGSFIPSPTTNFIISPHFTSTTSPTIDLFNHFFDF